MFLVLSALGGALTGNVRSTAQEEVATASAGAVDIAPVLETVDTTAATAGIDPDAAAAIPDSVSSTLTPVDEVISENAGPVGTVAGGSTSTVADTVTTISENPSSPLHVVDATLDGKYIKNISRF